jgi:aminoglycoside 3-N-acetyltransferase
VSPVEFVSGLAVRYLDRERVDALRNRYLSLRTTLSPAIRLINGTFDTAALRRHLEARVGSDFEILMVHSSVNHMHPMYTDPPLQLVRMLMEFCGPGRTLAMPAFYFGDRDIGGAFDTFKRRPRFDLRRTPSQMGLATELFRRTPGVFQSRHPVYRISAFGPLAELLTVGHEHAGSPAGPGTPFEFMARHNTTIIGIGKPIQVLTQAHHAEAMMGADFPVPRVMTEALDMTLVDGDQEIPLRLSSLEYQGRFNIWRLRQMMDRKLLREWTFHSVPMFATRASDVTASVIKAAKLGVTLYEPL